MARTWPARRARGPQGVAIAMHDHGLLATHAPLRGRTNDTMSAVARIMQTDAMDSPSHEKLFQRLLSAPLGIPSPTADKHIESAREEIFRTCSMYLPKTLQHQLKLSRLAKMPPHISGFMAWVLESNDSHAKMAFTTQTYHLAQIIQGLEELGRSTEECSLLRAKGEDAIAELFFEEPRRGSLHYALQPRGHQRCIAASFRAGLPKTANLGALRDIPLQTVRLGSRTTTIVAYARAKQPLSTYLRFLRERTLSDTRIPDPFGFRFIFATTDDRKAFKRLLEDRFPEIPDTRVQYRNMYEMSGDRRLNPFSARNFRVEMWYSDFAEARWEFQLMEAQDFVNLWCSTGAENWYLYRLRQLVTLFFKHCFPENICGVNWKKAMKECRRHVIRTYRGEIAR